MQWPPTRPGLKFRKFHFVPAAFSTSSVSMPSRWKIIDELVDQRDVDVALRVLDDFGGLGDLDARRLVRARRDDAAIERVDVIGDLGRRARRDLLDRRQPMLPCRRD